MEQLNVSKEDAERIAGLASHPPFLSLLKITRHKLEPEYLDQMRNAKTTEEKAAAVDAYNAFTKVLSVFVNYPLVLKKSLEGQL